MSFGKKILSRTMMFRLSVFAALVLGLQIFGYAQEKKYSKAELDSLAKVAHLKRISEAETKGIENANEAIRLALLNATETKSLNIHGFPKDELPDFSKLQNLESFTCTKCSNLNWEKLFEALARFPKLTHLALPACGIKFLPGNIGKLGGLEILNLKDNNFSTLPESFSSLSNLKSLNLEHCGYLYDDVVWDRLLKLKVEELNFSAAQITEVNEKIGNVISLKKIDFALNDIRTLPSSFSNLKQLQWLNLSQNNQLNLSQIFQVFAGNTALESLNLSECLIESVPVELGTLKALKTLRLKGNRIKELPASIGSLTLLDTLDVGGLELGSRSNALTALPPTFTNLKQLRYLNLFSNQLSSLPLGFGTLQNLTYLNLSLNSFSTLPKDVCDLKNLRVLFFANNNIGSLPENIGNLTQLEALSFDGNFFNTPDKKIKKLPESFCKLSNLKELSLRDNVIETLPDCFSSFSALKKLDVRNNLIQTLPATFVELKSLETLNLKANEIKALPENFAKLSALNDFDFSMNYQTDIAVVVEQLKPMKQLKFLDISFNKASREQVESLKISLPETKVIAFSK